MIRVSDRFKAGTAKLLRVSDLEFETLVLALQQLSPQPFEAEPVVEETSKALKVSISEAREISEVMLSMYFLMSQRKQSTAAFAKDIFTSVSEDANDLAQRPESSIDRLTRLLG